MKHKGKLFPILSTMAHSRSGGTAPFLLNLGTRWRWLFSLAPRTHYPLNGRLHRSQTCSRPPGEEKISCPCWDPNPWLSIPFFSEEFSKVSHNIPVFVKTCKETGKCKDMYTSVYMSSISHEACEIFIDAKKKSLTKRFTEKWNK